jgi:hypothetical protein
MNGGNYLVYVKRRVDYRKEIVKRIIARAVIH